MPPRSPDISQERHLPPSHADGPVSSIRVLIGLVRASRPIGWVAAVALYRIGLGYGHVNESWVTVGVSIVLTFPFCLYLFGLNDLADAASDRRNPRKGNWLHGASEPVERSLAARFGPWAAGAVVAVFIPLLPWIAGLVLAGILLIAWMYSSYPVRLKEIPIVDGLVTATIMIGLLAIGYLSGGHVDAITVEAYAVTPTLAGLHIFASVVDVDSDQHAGHRTLAVRVGARGAGAVAFVLSLATVATIPWLEYAEPIAIYIVLQALVVGAWFVMPRWFPPRRSISVLGVAGILTLLYLALFYEK